MLNEVAALVAFVFVGSFSPGPNNAVLWASGISFGFRRTVPHVVGGALGVGALVIGVAAGIGAFLGLHRVSRDHPTPKFDTR